MTLEAFRHSFPIVSERAYLFSGAIAPLATPVRAALERWLTDWEDRPLPRYDAAVAELEALREAFAGLINARPEEVAVLASTSEAANVAARMLAEGDDATLVAHPTAYPSTRHAWLGAGARVLAAESPAPATAFAVSHVAPFTGHRVDLNACAQAAHAVGARLVVDAAQSLGVLDIDVERDDVDVLYGTAMKWLAGPPGVALLYARGDLLERAGQAAGGGYLHAEVADGDWPLTTLPDWPVELRRVELGMPAVGLLSAARAGVELIGETGVATISARIEALAGQVIAGLHELGITVLTPDDPAERAGVVAAHVPGADRVAARLAEQGIDIGGYPWGLLRIDPHAFCSEEDVERALAALSTPGR